MFEEEFLRVIKEYISTWGEKPTVVKANLKTIHGLFDEFDDKYGERNAGAAFEELETSITLNSDDCMIDGVMVAC